MSTEIKVPTLGESVTTATIARWMKQPGEAVAADEPLVELETDKVTVEVTAPSAGVLTSIAAAEGSEVEVGALLGMIEAGVTPSVAGPAANPTAGVRPPPRPLGPVARPATAPAAEPPPAPVHAPMPSAAKLIEEQNLAPTAVGMGSGKDGRITKGDVLAFLARSAQPTAAPVAPRPAAPGPAAPRPATPRVAGEGEERVKMTRLRRTIALRLKEAQNNAAMLTTFNEVDMSAIMALRTQYRDAFEKKHKGVRLGYMSVFVRACCVALQEFPTVNAEIDGDDIVYKHHIHMGIAIGGANGLVVPVVRHADQLGFAGIEAAITDFGKRARDGGLKIDELTGGTFSITNGGIYGSLMSTPILNPPQSAILGMHKIQERAMVVAGKIEIRPMMYLALSYDHRIVDGKEAVSFLVRVKEGVEDPRRLLLDL